MRLLFVSHSFPPRDAPTTNVGGMQRVATELHQALQARPDVSVRTLALRSSWKWVHLKAVPFLASLTVRLGREARAHRADAILFTSMTTALPLLIAGTRLQAQGVQLAAIVHGLDVTAPSPVYQAAVRRLCRMLDVVMPVSSATAKEVGSRGALGENVHVVPNAIDLDRLGTGGRSPQKSTPFRISGAPELPEGAFLLVAVGRQVRRKGFAWFVERVMPQLPDRAHLWIAGDGPERENIEAAIRRAGLERRVRCLGMVFDAELAALYGRGRLFVMPNIVVPGDMEGFGIVMLEAGALGLPTVAADLEGIRDVIVEGVNGWLLPSGDAEAFAARIRSLMDDPKALEEASKRAAAYVTTTFRWETTIDRYVDILTRR